MFDFAKICNQVENLSPVERGALIVSESATIVKKFEEISVTALNPIDALATFIIGAVMADGEIDEKELLLIYPSLVKAFGDDFDFEKIKKTLNGKQGKTLLNEYVSALMTIISTADASLQADIVTLCLLVVAIDNKINARERRYIRQLCN